MIEEKSIPELRFLEFEGEWEKKKLKEVVTINRGGSPRPISKYITNGDGYNWIKIGDSKKGSNLITSTKEKIIKEGTSKSRKVNPGDILLSNSMSYGRPYISMIEGYIHDGWLLIKENKEIIDKNYLINILSSSSIRIQYKRLAAGSAVNNLNIELVSSVKISYPNIKEQEKIGNFFSKLDKKIELQEELIENLEKQKKGFMQKIFNQEVRFKDENGENYPEWEEIKLKDLGEVKTGNTPPTKDKTNYGEDYLFVSPGDIGDGKYILKTERKLSKKGFDISRKFPKRSVLFTCIGSTIGKIGVAKEKLTSNQQINAVLPNNKYNSEYLYYILYFLADRIKLIASNQAVPIINKTEFEKIKVETPSKREQNKIADFLSLADKRIDLEKGQLENYKEYKKGLIQRMFI